MQTILVLGAGMVAKPLVEYLLDNGMKVIVACNTCPNAEKIINNHPNGEVRFWEAGQGEMLREMIQKCDLVVSLLPYKFHPDVARLCIEEKKHLVTTSYISEEMLSLGKEAEKAGIILLNETGLDPGIDHMSAMRIIDNVHAEGGRIVEFYSLCGALPERSSANNPFGYKFSWSPKGVILASKNGARYLSHGSEIRIEPEKLFQSRFRFEVEGIGPMDVYPNRDSIDYIGTYNIPKVETMYRGTFRFEGWCEILDAMKRLDLLNNKPVETKDLTYRQLIEAAVPGEGKSPEERVARRLGLDSNSLPLRALEWLGLFSDKRIGEDETSMFDIVSDLMISKMMLGENEKDMIVLQHLFLVENRDGTRNVTSSRMIDYGSPATNTSIARTVGLPAAIASRLILEGKIKVTGVWRPVISEIYGPVLDELATLGIKVVEEYHLNREVIEKVVLPGS